MQMAIIPTIKQSQVSAGVTKCRAQAITVKCGEAIAANDILVSAGWDPNNNVMTVAKADANNIEKCRGPFFVADYAADSGAITPVALPWKILTGLDTSAGAVGDTVWLDAATAGGYTLGAVPAAVAKGAAFSLAVKIGRIIRSNASTGAILLEPGPAANAPMVGRVTLGGTSTTVTGFTAELDGAPCVATPAGATGTHTTQITATIASGTLTLTHATSTDICSYMIQA
jgi:hypothetical protein